MTNMCISAANYIIERTNSYNETRDFKEQVSLTCKRLQKLLYFSDIEYMSRNGGKSMFEDDFFAWPSGPVIPSVYTRFMIYQNGEMKPIIQNKPKELTLQMKLAIDCVLDRTWLLDTLFLIKTSHIVGGPWYNSYDPNDEDHLQIIPKSAIFDYYSKNKLYFLTD